MSLEVKEIVNWNKRNTKLQHVIVKGVKYSKKIASMKETNVFVKSNRVIKITRICSLGAKLRSTQLFKLFGVILTKHWHC